MSEVSGRNVQEWLNKVQSQLRAAGELQTKGETLLAQAADCYRNAERLRLMAQTRIMEIQTFEQRGGSEPKA